MFKPKGGNKAALFSAFALLIFSSDTVLADDKVARDPDKDASIAIENQASRNGVFVFDYGVPASPALNLVGLTPDKTAVQSSLKPFVLALPQLVSGGAEQSAAMDIAPFWLLDPNNKSGYEDYITANYLMRLKYRIRVDAALFTGDDGGNDPAKAKASHIALGFSLPLLDDSDPLTAVDPTHPSNGPAWGACIKAHAESLKLVLRSITDRQARILQADGTLSGNPPVDDKSLSALERDIDVPHDAVAQLQTKARIEHDFIAAENSRRDIEKPDSYELVANDQATKAIESCTTDANNFARFAPSLDMGVGVDAQGEPGRLSGFKNESAVLWLSGKYPIGLHLGSGKVPNVSESGDSASADKAGTSELDYWMLGGSARASFGALVATGNSATPQIRANAFNAWLGLERNSSWLILAGQAGYQTVHATNPAQAAFSQSGWRWLASSSLKLSSARNGIWLDLSYGSAHGTVQTLDDKTLMLSINFGPAHPANLFGENAQK